MLPFLLSASVHDAPTTCVMNPPDHAIIRADSRLEQKFSGLLASLGIQSPAQVRRPAARKHRLAEEMIASFLDVSGNQLVKLLQGRETFAPLHQLEVLISLFYATIDDLYIGVDSHLPSRFLRFHPFLLENLAASDSADGSGFGLSGDHDECHAARRVRLVPHARVTLQEDFNEHEDVARDYFDQHEELGITLLAVDPIFQEQIRTDVLRAEWTPDLGLWVNTAALLFQQNLDTVNDNLKLELLYPGDSRFKKYLRYVQRLIARATLVRLRGDEVVFEPLANDFRNHLTWSLESMFEPALADIWDQFVDAPKRVSVLGPFVEARLLEMELQSTKILDAATGTGCDSIYLAKRGYDVTSNEIEHRLIAHASEAAQDEGVELRITRFDWRHFEHIAEAETYGAVLALGNSLSCLPSEAQVRAVLARFAYLLRPDGLLIIDERNYPLIFQNRQWTRRDFRFPGHVIYCSDSIQARPNDIPKRAGVDNQFLTLEYHRVPDGASVGRFRVLPFSENQLEGLLAETGFKSIQRFYNLEKPNGNRRRSEFITYVASRQDPGDSSGSAVEADVVVAFTDITASTPAKARLGNAGYAAEWQKHDAAVRSFVDAHGGIVKQGSDDGFVLEFSTPTAAVECMRCIVAAPGTAELSARAGIGIGSALRDVSGSLEGQLLSVVDRICEEARPHHVVVDDRIKLAVPTHAWECMGIVHLRGAGSRQLWRLVP